MTLGQKAVKPRHKPARSATQTRGWPERDRQEHERKTDQKLFETLKSTTMDIKI